eukprot:3576746-Pyramimonas_sp.AAC.1
MVGLNSFWDSNVYDLEWPDLASLCPLPARRDASRRTLCDGRSKQPPLGPAEPTRRTMAHRPRVLARSPLLRSGRSRHM